jgi:chromosome segregation ATPase
MTAETAKSEIGNLTWRELELVRQKPTLEREVGLLALNNDAASSGVAERLECASAKLRANEAGIKTAQVDRLSAIRAKREAEISALQARRAEIQKEVATLKSKIESHQNALTDLLGVPVTITTPPSVWSRLLTLEHKIAGTDNQIHQLQKPLPDSGAVDVESATTNEALIETLAAFEGLIPQMESTLKWLEAVEFGRPLADRPRRIHFVWASRTINYQESYIFVESMCGPGPIGIYSNKPRGIDARSGTFYAPAAARP